MRENENTNPHETLKRLRAGFFFFFFLMGRAGLNLGILFLGSIRMGEFGWANDFGLTLPLL